MSATQAHPNLPPPKPDHSFTEKPSSALGQFFWRRRMWFEATFVLSMLEPWEKILLLTVFFILFVLVFTGVLKYMPQHLAFLHRRGMYYLLGKEDDQRLLWQWVSKLLAGDAGVSSGVGAGLNAASGGRVEL